MDENNCRLEDIQVPSYSRQLDLGFFPAKFTLTEAFKHHHKNFR